MQTKLNANIDSFVELIKINHNKRKGYKYKYTVSTKKFFYKVYAAGHKITIEAPIGSMNQCNENDEVNYEVNKCFSNILNSKYDIFYPLIKSITFKLTIEFDINLEIKDIYYKTCFFTKSKNTVIKIKLDGSSSNFKNETFKSQQEINIYIFKTLFEITLENDFIFDENGIEIIKMLII